MSSSTRQNGSAINRGDSAPPPTVFISYASDDLAVAEEICNLLEDDAIGCWIAPRNVDPGIDYAEQILDGIESTRVMVLLLSARANASPFVKREVERAISKGKVVIPFRIEDVRPSRSLELFVSTNQWIDAWTPPLASRVRVLASAIRGLLKLPPLQGDDAATRVADGVPLWLRRGFRRRLSGVPPIAGLGLAGSAAALLVLAILGGLLLTSRGSLSTSEPSASAAASSPSASAAALSPSASAAIASPATSATATAVASPRPGTFRRTGLMTYLRIQSTATLLLDGRVLIAGGSPPTGPGGVASAELYDPKTGAFTPTGSMSAPRRGGIAALLLDGRILVAGIAKGPQVPGTDVSADLYDPASGKFIPTGPMKAARLYAVAAVLPDGRVLVVAGLNDSGPLASAELYDPKAGTFGYTGSMAIARDGATATVLPDGRVLVVGGTNTSGNLASSEIYDPTTGKFTPAASLVTARSGHTATLLPDGRVLVVGGSGLATGELYDPTTGKFTATGSMGVARVRQTATLLANGRVLVAGGVGLASAELYEPTTGTFTPAGSLVTARSEHTATLLPDGRVLIAGGDTTSAELYQP